jgi:hypothetical protein
VADPGVADPGVADPGVADPGVADPRVEDLGVENPESGRPGFRCPGSWCLAGGWPGVGSDAWPAMSAATRSVGRSAAAGSLPESSLCRVLLDAMEPAGGTGSLCHVGS